MIYPDFMDYYLAIAIGLDGHEVVNVSGYTNSILEVPEDLVVMSDESLDDVTIAIKGLDYSRNEVSTEVQLEGVKPIQLQSGFSRINSVECIDEVNLGLVTVGDFSINPGIGKTEEAKYSIPQEKIGYITALSSISDNEIAVFIDNRRETIFKNWHKYKVPLKVEGDIYFMSEEDVYMSMQLILITRD